MLRWLLGQIFLVGLALSVVIGFAAHQWLSPVAGLPWMKTTIVLIVMSMMAAPVPLEQFVKTVSKPWPGILASIICLGFTPLLGWSGKLLLQPELAGGLIVACCVPSTLASSAVMTRKAGGDDTVANFVTILTNLGCVIVTPLWLVFLMGSSAKLSAIDLIQELAILVVLPIAVMQLMRWRSARFGEWAKRKKRVLSAGCQVGILLMVTLGSVQMGDKWNDPSSAGFLTLASVVSVVGLGLAIHLASLFLGITLARATAVSREQTIGVAFSASQKTLMIGINLAIDYGVSILPMITYHIAQLLVDAFIAEYWHRQATQSSRIPVVEDQ